MRVAERQMRARERRRGVVVNPQGYVRAFYRPFPPLSGFRMIVAQRHAYAADQRDMKLRRRLSLRQRRYAQRSGR